jgi:hypothetical protein
MYRGSTAADRMSLARRSVPMFPEPTIAAVAFSIAPFLPLPTVRSFAVEHAERAWSPPGERSAQRHAPRFS